MSDKAREWVLMNHFAEGHCVVSGDKLELGEKIIAREVLPMDKETEADLELMDRMIPPLSYAPWGELNEAWKRMRAKLGGGNG